MIIKICYYKILLYYYYALLYIYIINVNYVAYNYCMATMCSITYSMYV